jgi:serine/threonine protein kinase
LICLVFFFFESIGIDKIQFLTIIIVLKIDDSSRNTSFYELKIENNTATFSNLNFVIDNTDIPSFVYTQGLNNTSYFSYISNNTLNFKSLDQNDGMSVPLQQPYGMLLSARNDTHVFYVNENGFTQYDMARKTLQQITASTGIRPQSDTNGQVISVGLEDYIVFREQNEIHIILHNDTQSNYTNISNHSLPNSSTSTPTLTATAGPAPTTTTSESGTKIAALPLMATSTPCTSPNNNLKKRFAITTTNKSGSFKVKRQAINDGNPISTMGYKMENPNVIAIHAVINTSEQLPLDIKTLSLDDSGYAIGTLTGDKLILPTPNGPETAADGGRKLSGGDIAGIVVGVIVFVVIIGFALFRLRKRRGKEIGLRTQHSIQSREFDNEKYSLKDAKEFSHTISCSYDPKDMIYIDGRPDISPLKYVQNIIDFADLSGDELQKVEPEAKEKLVLFGGLYTSPEMEPLKEQSGGYAMRNFSTSYGQLITVHYFSESILKPFINSAYALSSFTLPNPHMVKHMRAIVLSQPTPKNKYRYIWITSPVKPEFSLYNILLDKNSPAIQIDKTDINFQIWSIYSMMKSLEALHSHDFVHLNVTPNTFFYEDPNEVTDWKLYGFDHTLKENAAMEAYNLTSFSAPELILETSSGFATKQIDVWSLGCTIYTLITGQPLFETANQVKDLLSDSTSMSTHLEKAFETVGHVNSTFEQAIHPMLQILPGNRKPITEIIQLWDQVYNMS